MAKHQSHSVGMSGPGAVRAGGGIFWGRHNELKRGKNVYFGRTMHCLPQRLRSMFFEKISSGGSPKETQSGKISKNVDLSL